MIQNRYDLYMFMLVYGLQESHQSFQEIQLIKTQACGLMTYLLQVYKLTDSNSFQFLPAIYRRLLYELLVSDLIALEEAVYHGPLLNRYGPTTTSMLDEWQQKFQFHQGIQVLQNFRSQIPDAFTGWKENIRNTIIAHVDIDISIESMEIENWPIDLNQLKNFVADFSNAIHEASRHDIRTRFLFIPPVPLTNVLGLAKDVDPMLWNDLT